MALDGEESTPVPNLALETIVKPALREVIRQINRCIKSDKIPFPGSRSRSFLLICWLFCFGCCRDWKDDLVRLFHSLIKEDCCLYKKIIMGIVPLLLPFKHLCTVNNATYKLT